MRSRILYCALFVFGSLLFSAQSNQMLRSQGLRAMANKDWHGASQYYHRLYDRDSTDWRSVYQYAEACRLNYELSTAYRLYQRIVHSGPQRKFPLTHYWLGQIAKTNERYAEAKEHFSSFRRQKLKKKKRYEYYLQRAARETDICDYAQALLEVPLPVNVAAVKGPVNSKLSEYAPYELDSAFYFSSIRAPLGRQAASEPETYSRIYMSRIREGKMQKPKALDTLINSPRLHTAHITVHPEKTEMVIARCAARNASDFQCMLYSSRFQGKRWSNAVPLPEPVNDSASTSSQPAFGVLDGRTVLFFASDRKGGLGGMDIWYCWRNPDGTYAQPLNAGRSVNTVDDEITPWFDSEAQSLYFSSSYHRSLGGFDIFKSAFSSGSFGEAVNIGYPLNTGYNETSYSMNSVGTRAYFASNRKGSLSEGAPNCCNDIYSFPVDTSSPPPVAVVDTNEVFRKQVKLLVPLTLYFHNDEPEPRTKDTVTRQSYTGIYERYTAMLPVYRREYSRRQEGDLRQQAIEAQENFFRDSVDAGYEKLQRFSELLKKVLAGGETVRITMQGYCSPLASSDYNIRLARRRISSLRNYFMTTDNGYFLPYINQQSADSARIIFEEVGVGELSGTRASDDLADKRNSVYSPQAASERKIRIIAVSFR